MTRDTDSERAAERTLAGVDDRGAEERIVIWLEHRPGARWAVLRAVNPHLRETPDARPEDLVFEGFELDDALQRANETLEDDVRVLEEDGGTGDGVRPFTRREMEPLLERIFFGR